MEFVKKLYVPASLGGNEGAHYRAAISASMATCHNRSVVGIIRHMGHKEHMLNIYMITGLTETVPLQIISS